MRTRMKTAVPTNHLAERHYRMPGVAQTMTTRELRETLLATNNLVLSCGYSWGIKSKSLGAGVHEVRLAPKHEEKK